MFGAISTGFGVVSMKIYDSDIEYDIANKVVAYRKEFSKKPKYLICDYDTKQEILADTDTKVKIEDNGEHIVMGLILCVVDGLHGKKVLAVG